jgi:transcriptional regulator GlxA family with amidase domain
MTQTTVQQPIKIGFLLLNDFTMMAFTSAIEPLRMANRLLESDQYRWHLITQSGEPCTASNHITLHADFSLANMPALDYLFVCGGVNIKDNFNASLSTALNKLAKTKVILGGICTGSYILARSGLLNGYRAAIHWENLASTREEFPSINVVEDIFVFDKNRYTCAGGVAAMDMTLHLISSTMGTTLATNISEQFLLSRIRDKEDQQRTPLHIKLGPNQPKLTEAVSLMEANIEEPISLEELSSLVGISRRQLERLFQKYLQCVPTRYYMELRLKRARLLLLQTDKPVIDIALACGFISATHFSKCYRDFYSIPPSEARRQKSKALH